jgi:hypothetical protein
MALRRARKSLAIVSSAVFLSGWLLTAATAHAKTPAPIDVTNDHVTCNTMSGTVNFGTPVTNNAGVEAENVATFNVTLDGCVDSDNARVAIGPSKLQGFISLTGKVRCADLARQWPVVGSALTDKFNAQPHSPQLVVNGRAAAGAFRVIAVSGGFFVGDGWGGSYLKSKVGPRQISSFSGAFSGGDRGANSTLTVVSTQDELATDHLCATTGLKKISIGIGHLALG